MPAITLRTGGHSDNAIDPAADMLEKVFSDPRMGLDGREVTLHYAGRGRGDGQRNPLSVKSADRPPSAWVTIVVQPRANDTCSKYKVVAAGLSAKEFAERLRGFAGLVVRNKGNYEIQQDREPVSRREITIETRPTEVTEKRDMTSHGKSTVTRGELMMQTKAFAEELRAAVVEMLREAGEAGLHSNRIRDRLQPRFPQLNTPMCVILSPLITRKVIKKVDRYTYRLVGVEESAPTTTTEISSARTKEQRVTQAILEFLPVRRDSTAALEHIRQQASRITGLELTESDVRSAIKKMRQRGVVELAPGTSDRYRLTSQTPVATSEAAAPPTPVTPRPVEVEPPPPVVAECGVVEQKMTEVRAAACDSTLPFADVLGKLGELLLSMSQLMRTQSQQPPLSSQEKVPGAPR